LPEKLNEDISNNRYGNNRNNDNYHQKNGCRIAGHHPVGIGIDKNSHGACRLFKPHPENNRKQGKKYDDAHAIAHNPRIPEDTRYQNNKKQHYPDDNKSIGQVIPAERKYVYTAYL